MRDVPFFGAFYRRTTAPFLSEAVTRAECHFIEGSLEPRRGARVLDLGCGEGRHLAGLSPCGADLVGVDFDPGSLATAARSAPVIAGDLRALPLRAGSVDATYCWYSTLFVFDEAGNRGALREVARVLRPGGRFLFQTVNPERLALQPEASFERRLDDGAIVRERSRFDRAEGIDVGERILEVPGHEPERGRYRLRYYRLEELAELFGACGLRIVRVQGSVQGEAFSRSALDVIVLAVRE